MLSTLSRNLRSARHAPTVGAALLLLASCGRKAADTPDAPGASTGATPPAAVAGGVVGSAPAAAGGTPSVITLRPTGPSATPPAQESPRVDQLGLAFTPMYTLARLGESVTFTNSETVAHNVTVAYSDNDSTVLDYETDPAASVDLLMAREGGYEVTCELHPGMRAFIFVTSAPYATFAESNGAFQIADVPPGSYMLSVWSVDPARRSERTLEVAGPRTEVALTAP